MVLLNSNDNLLTLFKIRKVFMFVITAPAFAAKGIDWPQNKKTLFLERGQNNINALMEYQEVKYCARMEYQEVINYARKEFLLIHM